MFKLLLQIEAISFLAIQATALSYSIKHISAVYCIEISNVLHADLTKITLKSNNIQDMVLYYLQLASQYIQIGILDLLQTPLALSILLFIVNIAAAYIFLESFEKSVLSFSNKIKEKNKIN